MPNTQHPSSANKQRLDKVLVARGLAPTRSQAEHLVALGEVRVGGKVAAKSGQMVGASDDITVAKRERYVSRAGLKLASVADKLDVKFDGRVVLDVGSSTGGFTDYALRHGAKRVIAVDVGTDQLHPSLHGHPQIDLYEKTDIRNIRFSNVDTSGSGRANPEITYITPEIDIIVIDVSFISIREVLSHLATIIGASSAEHQTSNIQTLAMVKPQFEADRSQLTRGGIVKNDRARRDILRDFEQWSARDWRIVDKADSDVTGTHGNRERFYKLVLVPARQ